MSDFEDGFLVGLLVGEGHFGGDGRQPQITLRMHVKHDVLFRWLERSFPGGRLYGPYEHGGRRYYQWMVRGPYLRDVVLPLLERRLTPTLDAYAYDRLAAMRATYAKQLGHQPPAPLDEPREEPLGVDAALARPDTGTTTGDTTTGGTTTSAPTTAQVHVAAAGTAPSGGQAGGGTGGPSGDGATGEAGDLLPTSSDGVAADPSPARPGDAAAIFSALRAETSTE